MQLELEEKRSQVAELAARAGEAAPAPSGNAVFAQQGQTVVTQINVAGDYIAGDAISHTIHGDGNVIGDNNTVRVEKLAPEPAAASAPMAPPAPNPFGIRGRITDPARFFNRTDELRRIFEELRKGVNISLVGESQLGKSSLLSMVLTRGPAELALSPEAFGYLSLQLVDNESDFYEALCATLSIESCRGFRLSRALQGRRFILCLDEVEKMTWEGFSVRVRSQLRGLADGPGAPLKLVIASRSPLARLFPDSPELDSPLAGICNTLTLAPFDAATVYEFAATQAARAGVTFSEAELARLWDETQGHPARLQQAAAALYAEKVGR